MKKIFILAASCALLFACNNEKKEEAKTESSAMTTSDKKPSSELLDMSAADPVKSSFAAFSKGDIDGMTADFDDNIRYTWSAGDSIVGKKAVQDYWKNRWAIIDSLSFSEQIVLPVQVNEAQSQYAPTGKWVLYWAMTNVKYKNGKKLMFWTHSVNHMNDAGKVDFIGMYYDRKPIADATKDLMK